MRYLNRSLYCSAVLLLLAPVSSYADSWSCTRNDHVREVVIERPGDGPVPCSVVYKKPTEKLADQTLWSADNAEGYCEEKAAAFVAKLESWQWACAQQVEDKVDAAEAGVSGEESGNAAAGVEQ